MKQNQKEVFLKHEGNAWFNRNRKKHKLGSKDKVTQAILKCLNRKQSQKKKLLEIGCGEAKRLHWLSKNLNFKCYGVEPSEKAVAVANSKNVKVIQGTADKLDFEKKKFDIIVFGFCLYLCDRGDLFQIAKEADRVLKDTGYLIILDFYSKKNTKNKYHHLPGIFSYKMDYRKLFDWHPDYTCIAHEVSDHGGSGFIDDENNWIAVSTLKKKKDM